MFLKHTKLKLFLKKTMIFDENSPCGHAGSNSKLVFCNMSLNGTCFEEKQKLRERKMIL